MASEGDTEMNKEELALQLFELQGMIHELKDGFLLAMQELSKIQDGDQALHDKVETNKEEQQKQLKEVVDMVLSLKTEFEAVVNQLQEANTNQKTLQHQVNSLQQERSILLDELQKNSSIPKNTSHKNSNDLLLLLAQHNSSNGQHNHVTSDHDSGVNPLGLSDGELTPPPYLSPMVKPYIASLRRVRHDSIGEDGYDSDSSVVKTAHRTLNLSHCLNMSRITQSDSESSECGSERHSSQTSGSRKSSTGSKSGRMKISNGSPDSGKKNISTGATGKLRLPPHEQAMRDGQRLRYAQELLESERKFCSSLWTLLDVFLEPLKESGSISSQDVNTMFPASVHQLYEHHCCILKRLEERMVNWKWQGVIGDIFAWFLSKVDMDIFAVYRTYLNDIPSSVRTINNLHSNSTRFRKYLKKCQLHPNCEGKDLVQFLLMPAQRIPRYVLLLKQLLKFTDCDHPDYFNIKNSVDKLRNFLYELNDSIEQTMQLISGPERSVSSVRSPPSSANSVKSSISSHDGILHSSAKDSGIHSNGEDGSNIYSSPDLKNRLQTSKNQRERRKTTHFEDSYELSSRDKTFSYETVGTFPKNRNKNRKKELPQRPMSMSMDNTVNGANVTGLQTPSVETAIKQRRKRQDRSKILSDLYETDSNRTSSNSNIVFVKPQTMVQDYSSVCQTLPTRGRMAKKVSIENKIRESEESLEACLEHLDLDYQPSKEHSQNLSRLSSFGVYGNNDEVVETAYDPSGTGAQTRLSKQKLGMIQKWRSQGDILGDDSLDIPSQQHINTILAKSMVNIPPEFSDNCDTSKLQSQDNIWGSQEGSQNLGRQKKSKEKKEKQHKLELESITPPEAFKTKKKSIRDSLKSIFFKRRNTTSKVVEFSSDPPEEISIPAKSSPNYSSRSSYIEANPDGIQSYGDQQGLQSEEGELGGESLIFDEDEPCSAV